MCVKIFRTKLCANKSCVFALREVLERWEICRTAQRAGKSGKSECRNADYRHEYWSDDDLCDCCFRVQIVTAFSRGAYWADREDSEDRNDWQGWSEDFDEIKSSSKPVPVRTPPSVLQSMRTFLSFAESNANRHRVMAIFNSQRSLAHVDNCRHMLLRHTEDPIER